MTFPSTLSSFTDPIASDRLNSPSHSGVERAQNAGIEQVEAVIGLAGPVSTLGTIQYDLRSPASDGGGHVQSANKGGTGQTSYSKGNILVASSSSVLTKLTVGSNDQVLVADSATFTGVKWGALPLYNVQSFISNGVWTKPAAATVNSRVFVELWGGGGGGATADGANEAGGGGGGGYINSWYQASALGSSILVVIGAGGASQATPAGGGGTGLDGNAGAITVFGDVSSILTAYAGGGGGNDSGGGGGGGGAGLIASGGSSTDSLGGPGGAYFNGMSGISRISTGGNTNVAGSVATYIGSASGGGGGGGDGAAGGAATMGGGGGGGARSNAFGAGGTSTGGGSGSGGSILTNGSVTAGGFPGGGGGASYGGGSASGKGGDGKAVIITFF